jgi:hypothetical protein
MIFPTAVLGMQAAGLAAIGLLRAIYNRSRR